MKKPVKLTPEERVKLKDGVIRLAEGMLEEHAKDYLLCYTGPDGLWYMSASNRTWAMGAALRAGFDLREGCPPQESDPDA